MTSSLASARLVPLTIHSNESGNLFALEADGPLPFEPKRVFVLRNLRPGATRAEHAVSCHEFLTLIAGQCRVEIRSRTTRQTFDLSTETAGLSVPPGLWIKLNGFSQGTVVLVACSEKYGDTKYFPEPQL